MHYMFMYGYAIALSLSLIVYIMAKSIIRDKEGLFTMIKGTIQQEDIRILNVYVSLKHINEKLTKL